MGHAETVLPLGYVQSLTRRCLFVNAKQVPGGGELVLETNSRWFWRRCEVQLSSSSPVLRVVVACALPLIGSELGSFSRFGRCSSPNDVFARIRSHVQVCSAAKRMKAIFDFVEPSVPPEVRFLRPLHQQLQIRLSMGVTVSFGAASFVHFRWIFVY